MSLILISIAVGVAVGFVVMSVMKSQLKSVRRQADASTYVTAGGLHLTQSQDIFLYQNTTRHPKPKNKK